MEFEENSRIQCDFIRNLCSRIASIHNEVMEHEDLTPKCEACLENSNDLSFIKNQLFNILNINLPLKKELPEHPIKEELDLTIPTVDTYFVTEEIAKTEVVDDPVDVYPNHLGLPTTFVSVGEPLEPEEYEESQEPIADNISNSGAFRVRNVRRRQEKIYECNMCDHKDTRKSIFISHMKLHMKSEKTQELEGTRCESRPNVFNCAYCPETFRTFEKILHHHKSEHSGKPRPESPYRCEICGASSTRKTDLRRHILTHDVDLPFKCNQCDKKYLKKDDLEKHLKVHIPSDFKYPCKLCEKRYICKTSLINHKRQKHSGDDKTIHCSICGMHFINRSLLRTHVASHRSEAPPIYRCDQCGTIFKQLKYMNYHRRVQHNIYTDLMQTLQAKKK